MPHTLESYQIVRELIAGSLLIVNIYLSVYFASQVHWRDIHRDETSKAAVALSTYFGGALVLRGMDWALAKLTNLNIEFDYPAAERLLWIVRSSWWVMLLGGAVAMLGAFCCIRVFGLQKRATGRLALVATGALLIPLLIFIVFHGAPW